MDIIYLDTTASTNDDARQMALKGAEHLSAVWANSQTAGRGRQGKVWRTYPDHSLAVSFVVKEGRCPQLPLLVSLAVAQTIDVYASCQIKWPNDVLCNEQKISGILVEGFSDFHIVGIGVNLTQPNEEILGTTLEAQCGQQVNRKVFLEELQKNLENVLRKGWAKCYERYVQKCVTLSRDVTWLRGGETLHGKAIALDESGALKLKLDSGGNVSVHSGEIIDQA